MVVSNSESSQKANRFYISFAYSKYLWIEKDRSQANIIPSERDENIHLLLLDTPLKSQGKYALSVDGKYNDTLLEKRYNGMVFSR